MKSKKGMVMVPAKPESLKGFQAWRTKMERRLDPSILEYVLRIKKLEVASCEAISLSLEMERELNAYIDERKEEEKEVKKNE